MPAESREGPARFGEVRRGGVHRDFPIFECGQNGIMRKLEQQGAFFRREFTSVEQPAIAGGRGRIFMLQRHRASSAG